eukprot:UN07395
MWILNHHLIIPLLSTHGAIISPLVSFNLNTVLFLKFKI